MAELGGPESARFSESLLSEPLSLKSLSSESLAFELLSRGESQCGFSLPSEPLLSDTMFWEFPPSESLLSELPPSDFFQEWPRQTKPKKGQLMNSSQGHSSTEVQ